MFYLKYLTMHGYRIFKQRMLSRANANAQPRLSFRCVKRETKNPVCRILKQRRLSRVFANAQTRLCFRCWYQ